MKIEDFVKLAEERFQYCKNLMCGIKNVEYSRNDDKLHNFKSAARVDSESPERALWGMYKKHLISIKDMVDDIENEYRVKNYEGKMPLPSREKLAEKITDSINYLVLLEALVVERIQAREARSSDIKEIAKEVEEVTLKFLKRKIKGAGHAR